MKACSAQSDASCLRLERASSVRSKSTFRHVDLVRTQSAKRMDKFCAQGDWASGDRFRWHAAADSSHGGALGFLGYSAAMASGVGSQTVRRGKGSQVLFLNVRLARAST